MRRSAQGVAGLKTSALWMIMGLGLGSVGAYVGAWFTPTVLVVSRDGWSGLDNLRVVQGAPQLPDWIGGPGTTTRWAAAIAWCIAILGLTISFGTVGLRLYQHVVVRLGWLTEEQVDEARRNEKQYF